MAEAMLDLFNSLSENQKKELFRYAFYLKFFSAENQEPSSKDINDNIFSAYDLMKAKQTFDEIRNYTKDNTPEMSMDEINAEIKSARAGL